MIWKNGLTNKALSEKLSEWHRWFAWYPVVVGTVGEGKEERKVKAWLCFVERMCIDGYYEDDRRYRMIGS